MAYGQTGSGKTFTVFGPKYCIDTIGKPGPLLDDVGLVPRLVERLFDYIGDNPRKAQFRITVSFLQIYMEKITDLLMPQKADKNYATNSTRVNGASNHPIDGSNLSIHEDPKTGIFVLGLTQKKIRSKEELLNIIRRGVRKRATNQTTMNDTSSRSHAILQVFVEQRWVEHIKDSKSSTSADSKAKPVKKRYHRKALMTIADLAGSERLSKSGSEGARLAETKNINKEISALGNCISALARKHKSKNTYIPFRNSKLTRILTESLSGNIKTIV